MLPTWIYTIFLRPARRCDGPLYWKLCFVDYMGMPIGILALAMVGMMNAMSVISGNMESPEQPEGADAGSTAANGGGQQSSGGSPAVSPEAERVIRLMLSILNMENHMLLVAAVIWSPLLVLPWLVVQLVGVLVELVLLMSELSSQDPNIGTSLAVQCWSAGTGIYNFLQVMCFLLKKLSYC